MVAVKREVEDRYLHLYILCTSVSLCLRSVSTRSQSQYSVDITVLRSVFNTSSDLW